MTRGLNKQEWIVLGLIAAGLIGMVLLGAYQKRKNLHMVKDYSKEWQERVGSAEPD